MHKKLKAYLFITFLLAMPLMAGRLYFYMKYSEAFRGVPTAELLAAFAWGIRFDLSAIAMSCGIFVLLLFVPRLSENRTFFALTSAALVLTSIVVLSYIFIDIQYYAFSQRHLSFELQNTTGDLDVIIKIGFREYLWETLAFLLSIALYAIALTGALKRTWRLAFRSDRPPASGLLTGIASETGVFFIVLALSVVMVRGGVQSKPMGVNDAFVSYRTELGVLTLNGVFTTIKSLADVKRHGASSGYLQELDAPGAMSIANIIAASDRERPVGEYPLYRSYNYAPKMRRPLNVVILIMESWSSVHVGAQGASESATPNFDRLAAEGLLFDNCFANAQRSIEGLPSIMASIPSFKGMVFGFGGMLFQTRMRTLGNVLSSYGYETIFAHGAPAASMGFDGLVKKMGFSRHMSMDDFMQGGQSYDGVWGIYDHYVFERMASELGRAVEPFMSVVYSLSSHSPYSLPSDKFKKFGTEVPSCRFLNSMHYSDYALGRFMELAAKEEYFDRTVFVLTSDHTEGRSTNRTLYDLYRIPCMIYAPGIVKPGVMKAPVSQVDLAPTVLDILKVDSPFTGWGRSALAPGERQSLLPQGDRFVYVKGANIMLASVERPMALFDYATDPEANLLDAEPGIANALHAEMLRYMKFSYELVSDNRLMPRESLKADKPK